MLYFVCMKCLQVLLVIMKDTSKPPSTTLRKLQTNALEFWTLIDFFTVKENCKQLFDSGLRADGYYYVGSPSSLLSVYCDMGAGKYCHKISLISPMELTFTTKNNCSRIIFIFITFKKKTHAGEILDKFIICFTHTDRTTRVKYIILNQY